MKKSPQSRIGARGGRIATIAVVVTAIGLVDLVAANRLKSDGRASEFSSDGLEDLSIVASGHHVVERAGEAAGGLTPDQPRVLASGRYVNYESPPVKALALTENGSRLFAANTPRGVLAVFDVDGGVLSLVREIPVGIDPVSVAVQPQSDGAYAWVVNMISDNVSVVDVAAGTVVALVDVDDEPVNIVFDPTGTTAFVVCQAGALVAVDTSSRSVVGRLELDMHTPRAAVFRDGEVAVAALHSGNNTTVVGFPLVVRFANAPAAVISSLAVAQFFEPTAPRFEDRLLSPWPDPPTLVDEPSPAVSRIVPDAGVTTGNPWRDILVLLDDGSGAPKPELGAQLEAQVAESGLVLSNATEILQTILDDYSDTLDHDVFLIDATDRSAMQIVDRIGGVGTTLTGMGVNPVAGDLFISNLEARNLTRLEPNLRGHIVDHQIVRIEEELPAEFAVTATDLHAEVPGDFHDVSAPNLEAQAHSLANPVDVVFRGDGGRAYVAALGADRVGVLDGASGVVLGQVDVARGPRSLALDDGADLLYVLSRTDLAITTVDVSSDTPRVVSTFDLPTPEPLAVFAARDFLYSARFSNNYGSSCALCHIDGTLDHMVWDLGDPAGDLEPAPPPAEDLFNHPVKGPMATQALLGLEHHEPYHWRGDRPMFADFNGAFGSLLGGAPLSPDDIAAFNDFVDTLSYPPNPFRRRDNTFLDPRAADGELFFRSRAECSNCHRIFHDGALRDPDNLDDGDLAARNQGNQMISAQLNQIQLVRQLRGVYKRLDSDLYTGVGLLHDGRMDRGQDEFVVPRFLNFFPGLEEEEILDLAAFVPAFPTNTMPVVGWQVLFQGPISDAARADVESMIDESLRDPSRCDIVIQGSLRGATYSAVFLGEPDGERTFEVSTGALRTLDDIVARVGPDDRLVVTAVPPGSGRRIAFDE